jgi:hypothetical protein
MAFKRVKSYSVFHFNKGSNAGTSTIIVYPEGEPGYHYYYLKPDRAHHIVDLLRNEDPLWFESASEQLKTGVEPVGERE